MHSCIGLYVLRICTVATFNHVKRNGGESSTQRTFYANNDCKSPRLRATVYKDLYKSRHYIESHFQSLICEKRREDSCSPCATAFSELCALSFSLYFFRSALTVTAKRKERILERLVIKSKQKGIDVIEVGSDVSLSFTLSLTLSLSPWDLSFPREIVSEKMAKITSETALFSTDSVNLYIHGHSFIPVT